MLKTTVWVPLKTQFGYGAYQVIQKLSGVDNPESIEKSAENKVAKKKEIINQIQTKLGGRPLVKVSIVLNAITAGLYIIPLAVEKEDTQDIVKYSQLPSIISKGQLLIHESTKNNLTFDVSESTQFYNSIFLQKEI